MAFNPNDDKFRDLLTKTEEAQPSSVPASNSSEAGNYEKTKQFQFTLQPSVREKIGQLAEEQGYRSASAFVNEFFKSYKKES
ncbi:hypothetical protein K6V78_09845 [Streptococcus gallolyticus]|nr:hypothetical protein [Streptococcus gallolyticus]MBY5041800.1 hypothetical protein [Streptococcus gallolyticus]